MPIGGIVWTAEIETTTGVWVSLGGDPQDITIERGRSDDLTLINMGKCTLRLLDTTGKYAAENTASPLYPYLRPMKQVRVKATYLGVDYWRFRGFLSRCETNPDYGTQQATMELVDLFYKLDQVYPAIGPINDTTTGAIVGLLLDAAGWTDPTLRALSTGDSFARYVSDGSASALAQIGALLETERGQFYISRAGVATYEGRYARLTGARAASQSTVAATLAAVTPGIDVALIRNRATVTKTDGPPQVYTDAASATEFGTAAFGAITSPYLLDTNQAAALAAYLVNTRKDPLPTARKLQLDAVVDTARIPMLARDLGDRITATTSSGVSGDYFIESITERIAVSDMGLTTDWRLTKRLNVTPFILDVSFLDGTDLLLY